MPLSLVPSIKSSSIHEVLIHGLIWACFKFQDVQVLIQLICNLYHNKRKSKMDYYSLDRQELCLSLLGKLTLQTSSAPEKGSCRGQKHKHVRAGLLTHPSGLLAQAWNLLVLAKDAHSLSKQPDNLLELKVPLNFRWRDKRKYKP